MPWYAKALAAVVAGYAFSPIDLIPDFVPVLGYLDDLILLPLGVLLVVRLIPAPVMDDLRRRAADHLSGNKPRSWAAAIVIVALWLAALAAAVVFLADTVSAAERCATAAGDCSLSQLFNLRPFRPMVAIG